MNVDTDKREISRKIDRNQILFEKMMMDSLIEQFCLKNDNQFYFENIYLLCVPVYCSFHIMSRIY